MHVELPAPVAAALDQAAAEHDTTPAQLLADLVAEWLAGRSAAGRHAGRVIPGTAMRHESIRPDGPAVA